MSSRCQRRRVWGVTMNEAQRSRQSALLAAARKRPVSVFELRAAHRTAEHPYLVTEGSVLELELRHAPLSGEHSEEADEHEVGEGSQGAGMLPASVKGAEPNFGPPQGLPPHRDRALRSACACLAVNGVGKPCAGEPHARFDGGPLAKQQLWRVGTMHP